MYSFKEMQDLVMADVRYPNDTSVRARVKNWLQEAVWDLESEVIIASLQDTYPFTVAIGENTALLPSDCSGIINMRLASKNGDTGVADTMEEYTADEMDYEDETPHSLKATTGTPGSYRVLKVESVWDDVEAEGGYVGYSTVAEAFQASVILYLDAARQKRDNFAVSINGFVPTLIGSGYKIIAASKAGETMGLFTIEKILTDVAISTVANSLSAGPVTTLDEIPPSGTTDGDLLILALSVRGGSGTTITPPAGYALLARTDNGTDATVATYYKFASSEPANYTITLAPAAHAVATIMRLAANKPGVAPSIYSSNTGSGTTSMTATSVTPTTIKPLRICVFGQSGTDTVTPPAGFSEKFDNSSVGGIPTDRVHMEVAYMTDSSGIVPTGDAVAVNTTDTAAWCAQQILIPVDSTTVVQIGRRERSAYSMMVEFDAVADGALVFETRYQRTSPRMINDSDTAWFVQGKWHPLIVELAITKGEKFIEDSRLEMAKAEFMRQLALYRSANKVFKKRNVGLRWG